MVSFSRSLPSLRLAVCRVQLTLSLAATTVGVVLVKGMTVTLLLDMVPVSVMELPRVPHLVLTSGADANCTMPAGERIASVRVDADGVF